VPTGAFALPFTVDQFFKVFATYNESVWPWQIVLNALAAACIPLVFRSRTIASRTVSLILAFFWIWMGGVYHLGYFTKINPLAWVFAAAFIYEGFMILSVGVVRAELRFRPGNVTAIGGWLLIVVALALYPVTGYLLGQRYPGFPTFGAPCPTTIFSIGILSFAKGPGARRLLVIPILWAAVASYAAFALGVTEDLGLLLAGAIGFRTLLRSRRTDSRG
jgi:hypothetical protein